MTEHNRSRRPTIRDVAESAGVSKSVVSLVLRDSGRVSEARRQAVLRAVEAVGYRPNGVARREVTGTRAVGVLLNDLRNPWFVDLIDGLHAVLHANGIHMLLGDGRLSRRTDESLIRTFTEMRVAGLILVGTMPVSPAIAEMAARLPTVIAGSRGFELPNVDTIANDDLLGAEQATKYLIELGHTRIAHVAGSGAVGVLRQQAYEATMRAHGLEHTLAIEPSDSTEDGGYRAAVRLLSRPDRPTAIFASNDMASIGVHAAAEALGIETPRDLSLAGYDNTYLAQLRHLWLTSVDCASDEVGRRAGRALLARIAQPDRPADLQLLAPKLIVRGSTAAPPDGGRRLHASPPSIDDNQARLEPSLKERT